ncbi:hypothetical protein Tco_1018754 [Tanacetum coccineum]|uniref:Uncharacterized protein n=1 Tax=Tanacetum coccineum TaxID=301880 RepID=A0ABQ5FVQ5_9ASTR
MWVRSVVGDMWNEDRAQSGSRRRGRRVRGMTVETGGRVGVRMAGLDRVGLIARAGGESVVYGRAGGGIEVPRDEECVRGALLLAYVSYRGHAGKTNVITVEKTSALIYGFWVHFFNHMGEVISCERGKLIQKLLLNKKCMGYLVRAYYNISPTSYYKDDSSWSVDLKSKTTEDIISTGSFVEALVLNHYVLVRKIL